MLNVISIYCCCCCWSVVNECENFWKSVKFRYVVFLPKEEGCSSSSSTSSSVNWSFHFDDAGCFPRVPVDVVVFLFFGADGWGMLSLAFTGGVAISVSSL